MTYAESIEFLYRLRLFSVKLGGDVSGESSAPGTGPSSPDFHPSISK